jgi:hypothetical protein
VALELALALSSALERTGSPHTDVAPALALGTVCAPQLGTARPRRLALESGLCTGVERCMGSSLGTDVGTALGPARHMELQRG